MIGNREEYLDQINISWKKARMHLSVLVRRMESKVIPPEFEGRARKLMKFMDVKNEEFYLKYKKEKEVYEHGKQN